MSSKKKIGIVIVVAVLAITFMTVAFPVSYTHLTLPTTPYV